MDADDCWTRIEDEASAEKLLDLVKGFHDTITVEARWVGRERLLADFSVALLGYGTLALVIDSQFRDVPRTAMRFEGVSDFRYSYRFDMEGSISRSGPTWLTRFTCWEITSEEVFFRSGHVEGRG